MFWYYFLTLFFDVICDIIVNIIFQCYLLMLLFDINFFWIYCLTFTFLTIFHITYYHFDVNFLTLFLALLFDIIFDLIFWCHILMLFIEVFFKFLFSPYCPQNYLFEFCASIRLCGGCIWSLLIFWYYFWHYFWRYFSMSFFYVIVLCYFLVLFFDLFVPKITCLDFVPQSGCVVVAFEGCWCQSIDEFDWLFLLAVVI